MAAQRQPSRTGSQAGHATLSSVGALPSTAAFRNPPEEDAQQQEYLRSAQSDHEEENEASEEETKETPADKICLMIDTQFEKGLLMFKELVQSDPEVSFEAKEQIFDKLLAIVSEGVHAS